MIEVQLTQNKVALIDDVDAPKVLAKSWIARQKQDGRWYAVESGNAWVSMHRFILGLTDRMQWADHKNNDGLDNRRANLRITTPSGNGHNRIGVKGCYFETARQKWHASITINYKKFLIGRFETEQEAIEAYNAKKAELLGTIFGAEVPDLSELLFGSEAPVD